MTRWLWMVMVAVVASTGVAEGQLRKLIDIQYDRNDYEFSRAFIQRHAPLPCPVLLSPVWGRLEAGELGDWLLADRLDARLQVQLHKLIWGAGTRR